MDNNNQPNINIPEQPPINSISPTPKKWSSKAIILCVSVVAIAAIIFIIPKYWDVAGGGATNQTAPDSVKVGEAAIIKFEVSVPGSKQNINGRYTDIVMHYNLTEFDSNFTQPKLISQTQDKEIYEFTIPPYPVGTQGEISYYIELKLDGHANKIDGYKKIKVGESLASTNGNNSFKTWDDGTGYVKGEVVDHVSGCEVDGACKLIVQAGDQKVALVYAEGDMQCLNTQAASWVNWGKNVNKGTIVKAYGAYKKLGNEQRLTFCDSKEYFILGADDPVPVGAYTEKFFDEVAERKAQVTTDNSPSQSAEGVWKIYKNAEYNFEFSYPQNWIFKDLIANPNQSNDSYDIAVGYTSPGQNAVRGITYCEAYSGQSARCEVYNGFIIDWEYGSASINDSVGGTVGISLKKSGADSKDIFRKILSTFKFIK